ncbi:cell division protein CrgA [Amycolatopsis palatopharyngis]|uniref:cell division protein CrgA n=1 Tax=Amycolatopsis palatopharyngis TaxID=187982 RepID=UPI000E21DA97|nr:cell division protein CrgA [Amycolatopsis palatopharyngis]
MPKSKIHQKTAYTPAPDRRTPVKVRSAAPSQLLYKVVMFGLLLLALAWIAVFYIAGPEIPFMDELGKWNFAITFVVGVTGLLMARRWR